MSPLVEWRFVVAMLMCSTVVHGQFSNSGTPETAQRDFIDRCTDHLKTHPSRYSYGFADCARLWTDFSGVFRHKDYCMKSFDFRYFIRNALSGLGEINETLYYSGVNKSDVKQYANKYRLNSIFQILPGDVGDVFENFCGSTVSADGMNHTHCPAMYGCQVNSMETALLSFWKQLSENFAIRASGHAHVLLNGSNNGIQPFNKNSVFGSIELPTLLSRRAISSISVTVITGISSTFKNNNKTMEICDQESSLVQLKENARKADKTYSCISLDITSFRDDIYKRRLNKDHSENIYLSSDPILDPDYSTYYGAMTAVLCSILAIVILIGIVARRSRRGMYVRLPNQQLKDNMAI